MQRDPIISIVTPFFNTLPEIFIDTVNSILNQSVTDWHWIIVNDGSSQPESLKYLKSLTQLHPRIKVLEHQNNKGLSTARNTGINSVRTPYLFLIDSDDTIHPTALEKFYWFLESNSNFDFVNSYTIGFGAKNYLWQEGFHNYSGFIKRNPVIPTALFRTELFRKIGGYDESMNEGLEDWDFWLKCAANGHWGYTITDFLTGYRTRENHEDKWKNWNDKGLHHFRKVAQNKYPNLSIKSFPVIKRITYKINEKIEWGIKDYTIQPSSKPSLLFIIPWMKIGGADQFNLNLIKQFSEEFSISIICTLETEHEWQEEFEKYIHDIFILPNFLHQKDYCSFISAIISNRRIKFIFLSNSAFGYMMLPYIKTRHQETKIVDYCHIEEAWREGGHPKYSINYGAYLDRQFVSSDYLKDWMITRGADPVKIKTVYIGIDPDLYAPDLSKCAALKKDKGVDPEKSLIVFAGRLNSQKQPDVLIQSARQLSLVSSNFILIIIGDGPQQNVIKEGIEKYRLEKLVRYIGALPNEEVRDWMNAADVFFLPSAHEGIALSIFEAMSLSCAILGADVGGQSELVDSATGTLIPLGTKSDQINLYSQELKWLIDNPSATKVKGQNARMKIIDHFSIDKTVKTIKNEILTPIELSRFIYQDERFRASGRLAIEGYNNMLELSKTSILDFNRADVFNRAQGKVIFNSGIYTLIGSLLKRFYNFGLNNNLMVIPKVIKRTGRIMARAGRHLMNIDD